MARRILTLEELKGEIRRYGISRLARQLGYSRTHISRIAHGQRQPGRRFLTAMKYQPLVCYLDVMPPKDK